MLSLLKIWLKSSAALAASLFHYKEMEIMDLKHYLKDKGVSVRTERR
jgi:cyclase